MKRTYTFTIDGHSAGSPWYDADNIATLIGIGGDTVVVTETTAVHAKEREVIEAALAWRSDNSFAAQNALFAAADALRKARDAQ